MVVLRNSVTIYKHFIKPTVQSWNALAIYIIYSFHGGAFIRFTFSFNYTKTPQQQSMFQFTNFVTNLSVCFTVASLNTMAFGRFIGAVVFSSGHYTYYFI